MNRLALDQELRRDLALCRDSLNGIESKLIRETDVLLTLLRRAMSAGAFDEANSNGSAREQELYAIVRDAKRFLD